MEVAQGPEWELFPFFIGCSRSGTTLLRAMFDSHPSLAVPDESYFVFQMSKHRRRYERRSGFAVEDFLADLLGHDWFRRWGLADEVVRRALTARPPGTLPEAIRCVYAAYAAERGKQRYGDKTPEYVLHVHRLAALFPEARFVHIVRDGRAVALSLGEMTFGPRTVADAALFWKRRVRAGRRAGARLGDRYREIRYEELVRDPEAVLRGLCPFLELSFDPGMVRYFERASEVVSDRGRRTHHRNISLPPSRGLRDWRREMSAPDAELFEAIAGDLLEELGYERRTRRIRSRTHMRAWVRQVGARTGSLAGRAVTAGPVVARRVLRRPARYRPRWALAEERARKKSASGSGA